MPHDTEAPDTREADVLAQLLLSMSSKDLDGNKMREAMLWFLGRAAQPAPRGSDAESMARRFHETYERLAPQFGYTTRPETRAFDPSSVNGRLMIAVCGEIDAARAGKEPT